MSGHTISFSRYLALVDENARLRAALTALLAAENADLSDVEAAIALARAALEGAGT